VWVALDPARRGLATTRAGADIATRPATFTIFQFASSSDIGTDRRVLRQHDGGHGAIETVGHPPDSTAMTKAGRPPETGVPERIHGPDPPSTSRPRRREEVPRLPAKDEEKWSDEPALGLRCDVK
jgi:hypothetical protein